MEAENGGNGDVNDALENRIISALTDYFSEIDVDSGDGDGDAGVDAGSRWELGYDGCGGKWRVHFVQLRPAGPGVGECPVYTACVPMDPGLECLLSYHVRFVLYQNGEEQGAYHYDPEWPLAAFDWGGSFTLIAGDEVLHVFERELYYEMYARELHSALTVG